MQVCSAVKFPAVGMEGDGGGEHSLKSPVVKYFVIERCLPINCLVAYQGLFLKECFQVILVISTIETASEWCRHC